MEDAAAEPAQAEAPSALDIVRTRSLASLVAQELERMILSGALPAGERLNEQALAARLGVSRGPVREAVRGLERSGLVVAVRNQGSYVRTVSAAEALEIYDLRAAITGLACAELARRRDAAGLSALRGLVRGMDAARRAGDARAYYALNLDFHDALLRQGAGPRTQRLHADLGNELHLFRRRALVEAENMRASNAEHATILRAIAAGDPAAARAAGEAHIAGGKRRFRDTGPDKTEQEETDHAGTHDPPPGAGGPRRARRRARPAA
jgi:DNA-binding GntR family transcriptional regulator